jgi:hypothetical protein
MLGWANDQVDNISLIKSVLCAALYPNVVKIVQPPTVKKAWDIKFYTREQSGGGGGGGIPGSGGSKKGKDKGQTEVFLHPTSVNAKVMDFTGSPFLVFLEQMETSKIFVVRQPPCAYTHLQPTVYYVDIYLSPPLMRPWC